MKNIKKFDFKEFLQKLVECSPRQFDGEKKAADLICTTLRLAGIAYHEQRFNLDVPFVKNVSLRVDNELLNNIEGCCFVGGKIEGKHNLVSSLISSQPLIDQSNINVNPCCGVVSLSNHYFAPSIATDREGMIKIIQGKDVQGLVEVKSVAHQTKNILVGNLKNPLAIYFAHYDSVKTGAIDNASGVSLLLRLIFEKPELLDGYLFVFSAAEELSYDYPVYWGHGYRVFEKEYLKLLKLAEKIVVVDCIGNGPAQFLSDEKYSKLAFPIKNLEKLSSKISILTAELDQLMEVYHSDLDDGRGIQDEFVESAYGLLLR